MGRRRVHVPLRENRYIGAPVAWTCFEKVALRHFVWHPRAFSDRVRMTELGDGEAARGSRLPVTLHRARA